MKIRPVTIKGRLQWRKSGALSMVRAATPTLRHPKLVVCSLARA
ncbi:hypothetical protein [Acidiphilium sp.]